MELEIPKLQAGDAQAWRQVYPVLWGIALAAAGQAHPSLTLQDREDVAIESITALMERIERGKRYVPHGNPAVSEWRLPSRNRFDAEITAIRKRPPGDGGKGGKGSRVGGLRRNF